MDALNAGFEYGSTNVCLCLRIIMHKNESSQFRLALRIDVFIWVSKNRECCACKKYIVRIYPFSKLTSLKFDSKGLTETNIRMLVSNNG